MHVVLCNTVDYYINLLTCSICIHISNRKWVSVGGIRSTGLSGCLGIADDVHHLIKDDLKLETTIGISSNVARPEVQFTNFGTAVIDGHEYTITHPITVHGKNIEFASRL